MTPPLLTAADLTKVFRLKSGLFGRRTSMTAVSDVTLTLAARDRVGLVGESGSGKSTLGRLLLGLTPPTAGTVVFEELPHALRKAPEWRAFRRDTALVPQNPLGALNPQMRIGAQIAEPVLVHRMGSAAAARDRAGAMLERVGMAAALMDRYPHQLSGGQRQRVVMARALILNPKLVIFDEAVSALDVSVQAQVVAQLRLLWQDLGLTYLFITHDLRLVRHVVDRVAVLYLGRIVEIGDVGSVYAAPRHPYTRALLASVPSLDPRQRNLPPPVAGERPAAGAQPGCAFRGRCPQALRRCAEEPPPLREVDRRQVACHRAEELGPVRVRGVA